MSAQPIEGEILSFIDQSDLTAFDRQLHETWEALPATERDVFNHIAQRLFPDDIPNRERSIQAMVLVKFWEHEVELTTSLEETFAS